MSYICSVKTSKILIIMEKTIKKCLLIALMSMIFWVISFSIMGLVGERIKLSDETQTEVAETWSRKQDFVGPILCVPVVRDSQNVIMPYTCMYVLPDRIELTTDVESEVLHRGIFDALVYRTKLSGGGMFNLKEMKTTGTMAGSSKPVRFDWSNTQVIIAINDKRGIEDAVKVKIGGKAIELNQSFHNYGNSNLKHIFNTDKELVCKIIDLSDQVGNEAVAFDIATELKGSDELNLSPIGNVSVLTMQGNCKDPSFIGFMLPSNREVTDDGFKATWKISSLNRNDVDQVFYSRDQSYELLHIGTKLLITGGQYKRINRALKYAFLVILLSLVAVFVAEMCVNSEINMLNYILIGVALVLFYLMLLSFSEWIGFQKAYLVSALMILGMVFVYLNAIIKKRNVAMAACSFMALVYIFIYVLLCISSLSLLVGTLGLFVILGVAMYFSLRLVNAKKME